mmetsp:Transcript_10863/g.15921  ORF Transcript_10863/g.15921 Transcript_10863/m.15921 type:complete len:720 (-) Transcript_10863:32-2191(-)
MNKKSTIQAKMHAALQADERKQYGRAYIQYISCIEFILEDLKRVANPALNPQRQFNHQTAIHADLMKHCVSRINTLYPIVFDGKGKPVSSSSPPLPNTRSSLNVSNTQSSLNVSTNPRKSLNDPKSSSTLPSQQPSHRPLSRNQHLTPPPSFLPAPSSSLVPAHRMPAKEMLHLDHLFHKLDRKGNQKLSLMDLLYAFSPIRHDAFTSRLMNAMNTSRLTNLCKSDFKYGLFTLKYGDLDERASFALRFFDVQSNGYVDKMDFYRVMDHLYAVLSQMHVFISTTDKTINKYAEQVLSLLGDNTSHSSTMSNMALIEQEKSEKKDALWKALGNKRLTLDRFKSILQHEPHVLLGLGIYTFSEYPRYNIQHRIGEPVLFGDSSFHRVICMISGIRKLLVLDDKPFGSYVEPSSSDMTEERTVSLSFTERLPVASLLCFAPSVFAALRSIFHVKESEFWFAFSPEVFLGNLVSGRLASLSESLTDGKSGNFFYTSHCGLFLCKTINEAEANQLLSMLPSYFKYCVHHPDTLLNRLYGLYRFESSYFIILENSFKTSFSFSAIYDLKGSTLGRTNPSGPVYKDLDFKEHQRRLFIGPSNNRKTRLLTQLRTDSSFLSSLGIIDYSFIVGVYTFPSSSSSSSVHHSTSYRERSFFQSDAAGFLSADGRHLYYFAIIDTLIPYNFKKKAERLLKTVVHGDEHSISVSDPSFYSNRFISFLESIID